MILKKISVLLVVSMLVLTSIIIVTNNHDVRATQEPENDPFDYQLIHNVTQYLSWRINQSYDTSELAKGRFFGSKGEHDAANHLAMEMYELHLYDPPDIYLNSGKSYRQLIVDGYNTNLEINYRNLTIHHGNETTYLKDFYTTTQWGKISLLPHKLTPDKTEYLSNNDANYTNLQIGFLPILNLSRIIDDFFNATFTEDFFDKFIDNVTLLDEDQLDANITTLFEHYYNFSFEDILDHPGNATKLPWYNETLFNGITSDYIAFGENPGFNPNKSWAPGVNFFQKCAQRFINHLKKIAGFDIPPSTNEMEPWWQWFVFNKIKLITKILYAFPNLPHHCRGIILYDYDNHSFDSSAGKFALPFIYINGTLGKQINQSKQDYRIDFKLNQSWNDNVESYNVVGQINGTDPTHTTLIECLYDSLWDQGSADSAIGCGMVLAFAKYMKQLENLSIIPKQNVRFILFGGEEEGLKGASYYENNSKENITTVIDLNQLGFDQRDPSRPLIMNAATNRLWFKQILDDITGITDYEGRKNDGTLFRTSWTPIGSWSDERAFAEKLSLRPLLTTAMFLKDFNWTRHHHDGENHTKGDTMDYYDENDIKLDMEMIWNVTRFFLYNPDCWFENVTYTYTDGNDLNTYNDAVNVSFTIHTTFPEDKATVKLILVPTYRSNPLNPGYPILYRYYAEKQFIVASGNSTSGYITLQLPKGAPQATYAVHLVLLNSRGDVLADNFGKGWFIAQATQKIYDFLKYILLLIHHDYTQDLQEHSDEIATDFHLNIMDFIHKFPLIGKFKDLITDLLTIYCLADDRHTDYASLYPPNDPPNTPDTPTGPQIVFAHQENKYTTRTTDPNGDQVEYKWRFHLLNLFRYIKWSAPSSSGAYNTQSNSWDLCGPRWVFVKARDTWHSPNVQSGYSNPLGVLVLPNLLINAPDKMLVGESVPFTATLYGAGLYQIKWNMGTSRGWQYINQSSTSQSYSNTGSYNVTADVLDQNQKEYVSIKQIKIKNLISNFTANSGNTNQTLWFNDTSPYNSGYGITNRTWNFNDGTIIYSAKNASHMFLTPGVYNVSLTVKDQTHNIIDVTTRTIHIDNDPPVVVDVTSDPLTVAPDQTVTLYADTLDSAAGIKTVTLNITLPDSSWQILTMQPSQSGPSDYDYDFTVNFSDTSQIGDYFYSITVEDNAGNTVEQSGFSFTVSSLAFLPSTPYYGAQTYNDIPIDLSSSLQAVQNYAFASFNNDIVLWMPMDTTGGSGPLDISGYGNNGVGHGSVNQTVNGFFGKGYQFDGTNDYLELASSSSLAFNAKHPMTWSLWMCPGYSAVNKSMGIISKACSNGSGFTFCLNTTSNDAQFVICAPNKGKLQYSNKIDLNVGNNTWTHLTIVYNGSSGWDVYTNGVKRGSLFFPVVSNTNVSYLLGAGRTAIGNNAGWFFKGTLDDVVMFRRGLGVDEIRSLFNASAYPYAHNFTGLSDGVYNFTGCAGYLSGCTNMTETRSVLVDTQPPVISGVSYHPSVVGFGGVVQVNTSVFENGSGLLMTAMNISYPNATWRNVSMTGIGGNKYQYNFSDTWRSGRYNYTVWAVDNVGNTRHSLKYSFNVTVGATISIATLKNSYSGSQYINITDPPNPPQNLTIVGRGLTWNNYYNASSGENILESYQGPVNYQAINSSWMPINTSLYPLNSTDPAYSYGYRTGNDRGLFGVYFKPNAQNSWPVAFAYNRSNDPTINVIRSKLVGVGYVDPASNWSYQYLQNVQSSQGQTNNYAVTYPGVFTGADITWSYGNTGLKEAITMSNTTKTALQNHPPSSYGLHDESSYLVFITKLDYQNLNVYNNSGILTGNVTINDKGVDFKDALGYFKCALPLGVAYSLSNASMRQNLTYRIVHLNGDTYLLSGLKVSKLNTMTFPVVVDPTLTLYSSSSDGYIYNSGTNYNTVQTASTGTVNNAGTYITIGQWKTGLPPTYYIYRGFVFFNTSTIPTNAYLDNATLSLYKKDDYSATDFDITIQNGQPTYPHDPMQSGDYNKNDYSGNGGTLNTSRFTSGYNDIKLTNLGWINRMGTTKLCLRSSRDISGTAPTGSEYINVYSSEFLGMCPPKLVIMYRNQSKIKNTGSTNIKGYLLIQVQYLDNSQFPSRWIVDNDTVNETTPRTINAGQQLALDTIFNGKIRASNLQHGTGTYRVYTAFRDPEGNILKTNTGVELKNWWQFSKT